MVHGCRGAGEKRGMGERKHMAVKCTSAPVHMCTKNFEIWNLEFGIEASSPVMMLPLQALTSLKNHETH
jgi:hypothetical protein